MTATLFWWACAAVVLVRCICVASMLNRKDWTGHPLQFVGISLSYPLVGGGAVGIALGVSYAPFLLLLGVSGWILSERRHQYTGSRWMSGSNN